MAVLSILERLKSIKASEPMVLVDASSNRRHFTWTISLTWYRNEEATSRNMEFFVIDSGPYEMMFVEKFTLQKVREVLPAQYTKESFRKLEGADGTILPTHMPPIDERGKKELKLKKEAQRVKNLEKAAKEREEKKKKAEAG